MGEPSRLSVDVGSDLEIVRARFNEYQWHDTAEQCATFHAQLRGAVERVIQFCCTDPDLVSNKDDLHLYALLLLEMSHESRRKIHLNELALRAISIAKGRMRCRFVHPLALHLEYHSALPPDLAHSHYKMISATRVPATVAASQMHQHELAWGAIPSEGDGLPGWRESPEYIRGYQLAQGIACGSRHPFPAIRKKAASELSDLRDLAQHGGKDLVKPLIRGMLAVAFASGTKVSETLEECVEMAKATGDTAHAETAILLEMNLAAETGRREDLEQVKAKLSGLPREHRLALARRDATLVATSAQNAILDAAGRASPEAVLERIQLRDTLPERSEAVTRLTTTQSPFRKPTDKELDAYFRFIKGETPNQLAASYKVDPGTISRWLKVSRENIRSRGGVAVETPGRSKTVPTDPTRINLGSNQTGLTPRQRQKPNN